MFAHDPAPSSPVDALSDGLVVLSGTGQVVEANRAAREVFGVRLFQPVPDAIADAWRAFRLAAGDGDRIRPVDVLTEPVLPSARRKEFSGDVEGEVPRAPPSSSISQSSTKALAPIRSGRIRSRSSPRSRPYSQRCQRWSASHSPPIGQNAQEVAP